MRKKLFAVALAAVMTVTSAFSVFAATTDADITGAFTPNTGDETVTGDFDVTYTFNNASYDTSANWNNFAVEVFGTGVGITARADMYAWGYNGLTLDNATIQWTGYPDNWETWAAGMDNAEVTVNVKRTSNVLTLTYDIVGSNGYTSHIVGQLPEIDLPDTLGVHLTGEKVKLSNVTFTRNTETPAPETTELDITGYMTASTAGNKVTGDFDVTYTFKNASKNSINNWCNFIVRVEGSNGKAVARADAYGWGYDGWETSLGGFDDDKTTVWELNGLDWGQWAPGMASADVTVNVKRTGNVLTFTYDITGSNMYKSHIVGTTAEITDLPDTLTLYLSGEDVKLSNITFTDNTPEETALLTTVGASIRANAAQGYDLGFVTIIKKADFEELQANITDMGVEVTSNATGVTKKISTPYVTDYSKMDSNAPADTYAFRSIITGITDTSKTFTAKPYVTYTDENGDSKTVYGEAVTRSVADCM